MSATLDYISIQNDKHQEILMFIHDLMLSYEGVTSKIRYRIPFYDKNSWVCYANPRKGNKVELVFIRANEMDDSTGLLQAHGRKQVAGITISSLDEIPDELTTIIEAALLLDDTTKYESKRKL